MNRRKFLKSITIICALATVAFTSIVLNRQENDKTAQIDGWILKIGDF